MVSRGGDVQRGALSTRSRATPHDRSPGSETLSSWLSSSVWSVIISCGDALIDMMPNPVPGGSNMNVAVAAARLGGPAAFLGRVSNDSFGDMIIGLMEASGVDLRLVQRGVEPTAKAIVEVEPTPSFRFEADGTAEANLTDADLSPVGPGPHIIHGGTFGMYRGTTAHTLYRLIRSAPGLVSLDPNVRPSIVDNRTEWDLWHRRWIEQTSLYRCSDEDLDWIWNGRSSASVADELLSGEAEAVVVTKGPNGCEIFTTAWHERLPGVRVDVVDTVGAGDAFTGALLVGLHALGVRSKGTLAEVLKREFLDITQTALLASALVCTRQGANPPWRRELDVLRDKS